MNRVGRDILGECWKEFGIGIMVEGKCVGLMETMLKASIAWNCCKM